MKGILDSVVYLIILIGWIAGVVLAKGFWSTLFALCIPFWAWYLVVEKVMINMGWM